MIEIYGDSSTWVVHVQQKCRIGKSRSKKHMAMAGESHGQCSLLLLPEREASVAI